MKSDNHYMTIGLWGLIFNSGNLGCSALSFSFLRILNRAVTNKIRAYVFFQGQDFDASNLSSDNIEIISAAYNPRSVVSIRCLINRIKECDMSYDFTAGDSFSDIYGLKRFVKSCLFKMLAIKYSKMFILGPQTYGPYNHWLARSIANKILHKANYICSRDAESANYIKNLFNIDIDVYTDVAFALPYHNNYIYSSVNRKIGINVSGLLWNGGYIGNNQFNLTVDYRTYITELIKQLQKSGIYDIYIIPHVISSTGTNPECDYRVSEMLVKQFEGIILAPKFSSPMDAKSFISEMDIFIGARMHATIGAFSSDVITIPFSYSRKFEGLYNNLNYPYTINAVQIDTQTAINLTLDYINNPKPLIDLQKTANLIIEQKLFLFEQKIKELIVSYCNA